MSVVLSRISVDPTVCHGKPCIKGTRIMVSQILDLLEGGLLPEHIASDDYFPGITVEDVRACIAFANSLVKNEEIHLVEPEKVTR